MPEQAYSPSQPTPIRKEKVILPDGRFIWVWGLTTAQYTGMKARAARSPGDPRGGEDQSAMILIQIVLSCYDGEGSDANRLFGDLDLDKAGLLTFEEHLVVMAAVNRVNGLDSGLQELTRDFFKVRPAQSISR